MFDGGADIFQLLGGEGALSRLQTIDGVMNFWTESENVSPVQPPPAQYDYSVKGRIARLSGSRILACAYNDRPTSAFGACQQTAGVSTALLSARVVAGANTLYIAQINGALYVISANSVISTD